MLYLVWVVDVSQPAQVTPLLAVSIIGHEAERISRRKPHAPLGKKVKAQLKVDSSVLRLGRLASILGRMHRQTCFGA